MLLAITRSGPRDVRPGSWLSPAPRESPASQGCDARGGEDSRQEPRAGSRPGLRARPFLPCERGITSPPWASDSPGVTPR